MPVRRPLGATLALTATAVTATLTAGLLTSPPASAKDPVLPVTPGSTLTLTGNGYGHGRGMSQWGAEGAARQGVGYQQILAHYYPGTQLTSFSGRVSVLITDDTDGKLVVAARKGLRAKQVGARKAWRLDRLRPGAKKWRVVGMPGGRSKLQFRTHRWRKLAVVSGDIEFAGGRQPTRLILPGEDVQYRGTLRAATPTPGSTDRDTVNLLGLDAYLKGVVPREVPASWQPAALQAQSVAARTYAAFERADAPAGRHYQICDTESCQVYGGYSAEQPQTNAAIKATAKQVLTSGGALAFTQFSSSNGGWSVKGSFDYLPAKQDPYDRVASPYTGWKASVTAADIQAKWPEIGTLTGVQVLTRDGNGDWGGRVLTLQLTGSAGTKTLTGDQFRLGLGLRSTWFTFDGTPTGSPSPSPTLASPAG